MAAHGHVDAVHDGLPPRLGVAVRDRGDALAHHAAHGLVYRPLGGLRAGVHLRGGLRDAAVPERQRALRHVHVVAREDLGDALRGQLDLPGERAPGCVPRVLRHAPEVGAVAAPQCVLDGAEHGAVRVLAVPLDERHELRGGGLREQVERGGAALPEPLRALV